MKFKDPTLEPRIASCEALARELAELQEAVSKKQEQLYSAVWEVFPENRGGEAEHGLVSVVARRVGWTREYVARIRDRHKTKS